MLISDVRSDKIEKNAIDLFSIFSRYLHSKLRTLTYKGHHFDMQIKAI